MSFLWHDWAGYIGVVLVLLAFLLLQARKLHGNGLVFQLMNVLGAVGVMLSLLFGSFNTSAFVMQLAWLLIGIYGIANSARVRRELRDVERKIHS
ncbi:CBU_0592 family membrane protein [Dyella subtropica]|uniref:CBU_0592 family membrane protein n=1 Tax=Dyella subtropica TaxID=2992127 RepID=UPI00224D47B9|nr:hypothetical protein [Dyella subtropica]